MYQIMHHQYHFSCWHAGFWKSNKSSNTTWIRMHFPTVHQCISVLVLWHLCINAPWTIHQCTLHYASMHQCISASVHQCSMHQCICALCISASVHLCISASVLHASVHHASAQHLFSVQQVPAWLLGKPQRVQKEAWRAASQPQQKGQRPNGGF